MKVILYMAISADGFVAKKSGDSDWVAEADIPEFKAKVAEAGCIVVGRRTFDQYLSDLYPLKGVTNIVVTTNPSRKSEWDNVIFTDKSPREIVQLAKEKGHDKILVVGGGTINGLFLSAGGVDEVYLDVHPLILGEGIKVFENCEVDIKLDFLGLKKLAGGLVLLHYKVLK